MNTRLKLQFGLVCLQELDRHMPGSRSPREISRAQGIPLAECREILESFAQSGLIEKTSEGRYSLVKSLEEFTSLEVVQAIITPRLELPAFQMLFQAHPGALRKTLEAAGMPRVGDGA